MEDLYCVNYDCTSCFFSLFSFHSNILDMKITCRLQMIQSSKINSNLVYYINSLTFDNRRKFRIIGKLHNLYSLTIDHVSTNKLIPPSILTELILKQRCYKIRYLSNNYGLNHLKKLINYSFILINYNKFINLEYLHIAKNCNISDCIRLKTLIFAARVTHVIGLSNIKNLKYLNIRDHDDYLFELNNFESIETFRTDNFRKSTHSILQKLSNKLKHIYFGCANGGGKIYVSRFTQLESFEYAYIWDIGQISFQDFNSSIKLTKLVLSAHDLIYTPSYISSLIYLNAYKFQNVNTDLFLSLKYLHLGSYDEENTKSLEVILSLEKLKINILICKTIENLKNLTSLIIHHSHTLRYITGLTALKTLQLIDAPFAKISACNKLTYLSIRQNNSEIPKNLPSLKTFVISNKNITIHI